MTKSASKWLTVSAYQSCSFNCKWLPPMEAAILKEPFQPIRIVLLIANGCPLRSPSFSREPSVQSSMPNQISPRHLRGASLNAALV